MSSVASRPLYRLTAGPKLGFLCAWMSFVAGLAGAETVAQTPLAVAGDLPGNLLLVPSVEWPTIDSVANLGDYDVTRAYYGYFDSAKCYSYSFSNDETQRHFYPVAPTETHTCDNALWSGNYLNWAATPTIDPFRKALTGGYRVKDTPSETWLEKARYDSQGAISIYPNRRIPASGANRALVQGATPANWDAITYRIFRFGNKLRFTSTGDLNGSTVAYNPSIHTELAADTVYNVSLRVKVCDPAVGVEPNCVQYRSGWKPEGLIQKYSDRIRYSVFSYLNDSDRARDGGVLRARQKFVGPTMVDPVRGVIENPNREWDPATGQAIRNPDPDDARSTTERTDGKAIEDSGVINYINKFGQMTSAHHKRYDPVSELYYAAIRYLKRLPNVLAYTRLYGTPTEKYTQADGFPVIAAWDEDPIQYSCGSNALLGIGDVYTYNDKNLPGSAVTSGEPERPENVIADTTVNVVTATQKVAQLEGISINTPFGAFDNSAFIAGLAYDAHTKDLRPDLPGMQTASTYWVDVREGQVLAPRASNQYWLAAKYGGFEVPEDYDPYAQTDPLDATLWSSGEMLSTGDPRPENFFVASEAHKMAESLTRAFAKVASQKLGSGASLASNSTQLDTGAAVFQSQFYSGTWRGDLRAFQVLDDGSLAASPRWRASTHLKSADWAARPIYFYNPQEPGPAGYGRFEWEKLDAEQRKALGSRKVVDYLRGERSNEEGNENGSLRIRASVLGDIVNSVPVYVGKPNPRLYATSSFTGVSSYTAFAAAKADRKGVIYVGANDGMLHGFDAATGAETYGFVPNAAIMNGLQRYSDPGYEHRYFVDGESAIADVYDTAASAWRSVLVGSLGRGGPGLFALDITNPSDVQFLWEKSGEDLSALGKNIGRPVIAQVADGDWRVLLGNGLDSTTGSAQLIMINVLTAEVTVVNTDVSGGNGLTAVLARDSNADGFADQAYAGDLRGNLWKFRNLAGTPSVTKLFTATDESGNAQPITAAPAVARDPATGTVWAFFGTGRYLGTSDLRDTQVQTWYGIKDTGTATATRDDLVTRRIVAEGTIGSTPVRAIQSGDGADLAGRRGWYIDLVSPEKGAEGERMVVHNRFQASALIGTTRIPEAVDPCNPRGRGFIMAIEPFSGAQLDLGFFDVNHDGKFDASDMIMVNGELMPVTGVGFESSPHNPIFNGDRLNTSLDDGSQPGMLTRSPLAKAARLGWRELVN